MSCTSENSGEKKSTSNMIIQTGTRKQPKVADTSDIVCSTKSVIIILEYKRGLYVVLRTAVLLISKW